MPRTSRRDSARIRALDSHRPINRLVDQLSLNREGDSTAANALMDGGIAWVFHFRSSEVNRWERETIARAERERFLRLAVTFGSVDRASRAYRSTTVVHLWQMTRLPSKISWRRVLVHVFSHEPLHHAIGRCLVEMSETGDQEWVISKLGDARWW